MSTARNKLVLHQANQNRPSRNNKVFRETNFDLRNILLRWSFDILAGNIPDNHDWKLKYYSDGNYLWHVFIELVSVDVNTVAHSHWSVSSDVSYFNRILFQAFQRPTAFIFFLSISWYSARLLSRRAKEFWIVRLHEVIVNTGSPRNTDALAPLQWLVHLLVGVIRTIIIGNWTALPVAIVSDMYVQTLKPCHYWCYRSDLLSMFGQFLGRWRA